MEKVDITIVGAGAIGLAVAAELSHNYRDIFVIEKNSTFGQETSSRNSEVIHAGIYYPPSSQKTKTCIEGKHLLYEFCAAHNIHYQRMGKLIVAIDSGEEKDLEELFRHGLKNGVTDLKLIFRSEIKKIEPYINAKAAIYSPSTGIIDSHRFMQTLVWQFKGRGGQIAYNTELIGVEKTKDGFKLVVKDKEGENFKFFSRILINCAGLNSGEIAAMAGLVKSEYKLKYCKGDYFRVQPNKAKFITHLVYPVPKKDHAGLGIHATLDLAGALRLGPDDEYVDKINYDVNPDKRNFFYEGVSKFLSFIEPQDIYPDMAGIRPKLQGPGEGFRDFIIRDETDNSLSGFINLIGIESPGLTGSLSIARLIRRMIKHL